MSTESQAVKSINYRKNVLKSAVDAPQSRNRKDDTEPQSVFLQLKNRFFQQLEQYQPHASVSERCHSVVVDAVVDTGDGRVDQNQSHLRSLRPRNSIATSIASDALCLSNVSIDADTHRHEPEAFFLDSSNPLIRPQRWGSDLSFDTDARKRYDTVFVDRCRCPLVRSAMFGLCG